MSEKVASWKRDFLIALGMLVIGSLLGLLWNPSALRATDVKITRNPLASAYLEEIEASAVDAGLSRGSLQIVDARPRRQFEDGHLVGALPCWDEKNDFLVPILLKLLPLNSQVVVVDDKPPGYGARRIAGIFAARGYDNVRILKGGVSTWKQENRRLVTGWDFDAVKEWGTSR